ncbi:MAG: alpha-D-glucose phosphate-specific phosphoglucomutase [Alphaproteobacteria bacterium]|jgi:phosphoglucomutase|nr:alpha-D-glucose phosphate-specific phosphoglucomutase [Alphaproteobacteria bacterium]
MEIKKIAVQHFSNQKPGTSGLRKKTKEFMQPFYVESYMQAVFNAINVKDKTFVIGGDGRYYNSIALQKIIAIAIANGAKKIYVAQNGILCTPAISNFILQKKLDFGVMLSASHNPAGVNGDFGIKVNTSNGAPASVDITTKIYEETLKITEFFILDNLTIDTASLNTFKILNTEIEVFNSVLDYANKMEEIFDFVAIKNLLSSRYNIAFNGFSGSTGIFAEEIFGNRLGVNKKYLLNTESKEDFGGLVPDPNPTTAADYINYVKLQQDISLGLACDADGDRNMLFSKKYNLEPSDSIAIILKYSHLVDYYKGKVYGVARSKPTSKALDFVAKKMNVDCYSTPTGWKFFGSLLEAKKITFCAEESYGTGSNHSAEKDGIWALLFWLHIIAKSHKTFDEILEEFWVEYGRVYFTRHDLENLEENFSKNLVANLENNARANLGKTFFGNFKVENVENFSYTDIITGESVSNQGLIITFNNNAEVMVRISGTGTDGATIRLYLSKYEEDLKLIYLEKSTYLQDFVKALYSLMEAEIKPSVIV